MAEFTWLPANQAAAEDVEAVFATGGPQVPLPGAEGARDPGNGSRTTSRRPGSVRSVTRFAGLTAVMHSRLGSS